MVHRSGFVGMPPADRPHAGDQPKPVREQDENENRGEEPESLLDQVMTDNPLEELMKRFHQPLGKVL
jgi:hypothetical protein